MHADTHGATKAAYPTHTHGLDTVKLPELFINAQAFGPQVNGLTINEIVHFLLTHEKEYKEVQERKETVKIKLWGEDELVLCIRPVDVSFKGVVAAYSSEEQRKDLVVSQLYVDGDDHVLEEKYFQAANVS